MLRLDPVNKVLRSKHPPSIETGKTRVDPGEDNSGAQHKPNNVYIHVYNVISVYKSRRTLLEILKEQNYDIDDYTNFSTNLFYFIHKTFKI